MDPLSMTFGIVGVAGAFSTCIDILKHVEIYKAADSSSDVVFSRFDIEKRRLQDWAEAVGIEDGALKAHHHDRLDDPQIHNMAEKILLTIAMFFNTADNLSDKLRLPPVVHNRRSLDKIHQQESVMLKANRTMSSRAKLKWTFIHQDRLTRNIEGLEHLIDKLFWLVPPVSQDSLAISSTLLTIDTELRYLVEEKKKREKPENIKMIDDLLDAPRLQDELESHTKNRLAGTCEWIFHKPIYKDWLLMDPSSTAARFLWIYGPMGYGKSVLCSNIITSLRKTHDPFVFHFFSPQNASSGSPDDVIRHWIRQIARCDDLTMDLVLMHLEENLLSLNLVSSDLWKAFRNIVLQIKHCVFILDGFDQYEAIGTSRSEFLVHLKESLAQSSAAVILVSRDDPDIRAQMIASNNLVTGVKLYSLGISKDDTLEDIKLLSHSITEEKLAKKSESLRLDFASQLTKRCDGMFLWLAITRQDLHEESTKKALQQIVDSVPREINSAYEKKLERIRFQSEYYRERGFKILQWTILSTRPLTVGELTLALAIDLREDTDEIGSDDLPDSINDNYIETQIRSPCALLVDVESPESGCKPERKVVQLMHFSVKEYLLSVMDSLQNGAGTQLQGTSAQHLELAKICLAYVCRAKPNMDKSSSEPYGFNDTFIDYAIENWLTHQRMADSEDDAFHNLLVKFLDSRSWNFRKWSRHLELQAYFEDWTSIEFDIWPLVSRETTTPLYWAAHLGFVRSMEVLYKRHVSSIDMIGGMYGTALQATCVKGNHVAAKALLDWGANVNIQAGGLGTALGISAYYGNKTFVVDLLKHGARVDDTGENNRTPLYFAARMGHADIAKILLEHKADSQITNQDGWTPLNIASSRGYLEIVRLLLDRRADIETANNNGWTPLNIASNNSHLEIVRLLLDKGADVERADNDGWTPLNTASSKGYLEIVRLLLDRRADIETANNNGWTPLNTASNNGHPEIVRLLLDKGADVERADNDGWTPLNTASNNDHLEIVRLLLDKGADIERANNNGWTPLIDASNNGHLEIVRLLLDKGADVDRADNNGWTPLIDASSKGHLEVVRLLLDKGADLTVQTKSGQKSLYWAARNGHLEVTQHLLNKGADLAEKDPNGVTSFFAATLGGHIEVLKLLQHKGASSKYTCKLQSHQDNQGRTVLHCAAKSGNVQTLDVLLNINNNYIAEDNFGRNLLDYACMSGSSEMVKRVLQLYHTDRWKLRSSSPWSPFHWACRDGSYDILEILTKAGIQSETVETKMPAACWSPFDLAVYWNNTNLISSKSTLSESHSWLGALVSRTDAYESTQISLDMLRSNDLSRPGKAHNKFCDGCDSDIFGVHFFCKQCKASDYCFLCKHSAKGIHRDHQWSSRELTVSA